VPTSQSRNSRLRILPTFDFGNGLTDTAYQDLINQVNAGIQNYNGMLTSADGVATQIDIDSKSLGDFNSRLVNAVGSKYGFDSIEYEKAGGVRTSDIKHKSHKTTATPTK